MLSVRVRPDGTYAVTLGPAPRLFWLRTERPLRLGQLIELRPEDAERISVSSSGNNLVVIEGGSLRVIADPFARRVVAPEWLHKVRMAMRTPLFAHQQEGAGWLASRLSERKGAILADQPGLGKTRQGYAALLAARLLPAIVVCPANLKRQWAREATVAAVPLQVSIVRGNEGPVKPAHIVIANYDILASRERELMQLGAKCIIFDEVHTLKEPHPEPTHRAAVATRIAHRIGCAIGMTGTPVLNRPEELWRILHIIDPKEWPRYSAFRDRYCVLDEEDPTWRKSDDYIITSHGVAARIDELRARIGPLILRRLKSDVLKTLPPKQRRSVVVRLEEAYMRHYMAAERDVVAWIRATRSDAAANRAAGRGRAMVKLTMLRHIAALGKLHGARKYLQQWFAHERRPIVVFGFHVDVLEGVLRIGRGLGLRTVGIDGDSTERQRQLAVDRFNSGFADLFLAPIRSAGVGLNLQYRCRDAMFLERTWVPGELNQAEDRVHRLGSIGQVTVTYLDAHGTVDEHMAHVLVAKQRLIDGVVDEQPQNARAMVQETIDEVLERMSRSVAA